MPTLREVKTRIQAVKKIERIATALEVVSLTRLKKIEAKTERARVYFDVIRELAFDISQNLVYEAHPFLKERTKIKNYCLIVVSSDKGLCGEFNANIARELKNLLQKPDAELIHTISIGKKGTQALKKLGVKTQKEYNSSLRNMDYLERSSEIASSIADLFLQRKIDKVVNVYNEFKKQFLGKPKVLKILPLKLEGFSIKRVRDYIYEPSPYSVLEELLKEYLANQIGQVILESNAAEEIARMLAMKKARDNADEAIKGLNLSYHKQRQMRITRELIDIATAANA